MRRRVLVASLLSTLAALVVLGVPLGFVLAQRNYREAVLALLREANAAQRLVPENGSDASVKFKPADGDVHLALYDGQGARIAGRGPERGDRFVLTAGSTQRSADGRTASRLVVAIPVDVGGDFFGIIRADDPISDLHRRDRNGWVVLGALGFAAMLAAAGAGLILARRLILPAEELRNDARRLGEGDFTVKPRSSGVGELDDISADLARAAGRLDRSLNRERSFSADASHQLKTPVASLRLAIEAELHTPTGDASVAMRDLLVDVERLESTIANLLALARDTHSDRQRLDVRELLVGAQRRFATKISPDRPIDIRIDTDSSAPIASMSAIGQVLDVLIDNAVRHGAGRVTLSARSTGAGGAVLGVSDEGQRVIDEQILRERRADSAHGNGIGLALARRLVETEGGQLRLAVAGPNPSFEIVLSAGP